MNLGIIELAAQEVREHFEQIAKREGFYSDLAGLCARASTLLVQRLTAAGIEAHLMRGTYDDANHCWVLAEGHYVDVTATQFSDKLPKVYITEEGEDKKYESWAEDEDALETLQTWPDRQLPQPADWE